MSSEIDVVVSTCHIKDLKTWKSSSKRIIKCIKAKRYVLIVPDDQIKFFSKVTPKNYEILGESTVLDREIYGLIETKFINKNSDRKGWYLQQFLKINFLFHLKNDEIAVIWDADTFPLRNINFFSDDKLIVRVSEEFHSQYFEQIFRFVGLLRQINKSFISQFMPIKIKYFKDLTKELNVKSNVEFNRALIESIDFSETSGFSEYELLGTWMTSKYSNEIQLDKVKGIRTGKSYFFSPKVLLPPLRYLMGLILQYDYVAFESWESSKKIRHIIRDKINREFIKIKKIFFLASKMFKEQTFYSAKHTDLFSQRILEEILFSNEIDSLIQIGANDGVQNDPLRFFLASNSSKRCLLIEPIPYYANKLKKLYAERVDVTVIQKAISSKMDKLTLYFIDPELTKTMNGDGPDNNWADGQGSSDKEIVKYWIRENHFRGEDYRKNIPLFINSIRELDVQAVPLKSIKQLQNSTLLVIDVQGAELDVLESIDFEKVSPLYIYVEDDGSSERKISDFLVSHKYEFLGGANNKIFRHSR